MYPKRISILVTDSRIIVATHVVYGVAVGGKAVDRMLEARSLSWVIDGE